MNQLIDLRSETVTKPTAAMRAAMTSAEVGDDTLGEDPTVHRLERTLADAFGFGAGLFLPSGVMANHLALRLLVEPGQEVIADADAHFLVHEDAGAAWHGGIQSRTTLSDDGVVRADDLRRMARPTGGLTVGTQAVAVENTHNRSGGRVYPIEHLRELRVAADELAIAIHCDGARIWNAHVRSGTPLRAYGEVFDTLAVSLSKGLGAPVGSVLLFDASLDARARAMRHRLGGGMRQAGILAAAGLYAFDNHLERIREDHSNATLIADVLAEGGCRVRRPETNIVIVDVNDAAQAVDASKELGVRVTAIDRRRVRIVTHLDVSTEDCERAALAIVPVLAKDPGA